MTRSAARARRRPSQLTDAFIDLVFEQARATIKEVESSLADVMHPPASARLLVLRGKR
jgi:hypothetical protein